MQLRRLGSPTSCPLQVEAQENPGSSSSSSLRTREAGDVCHGLRPQAQETERLCPAKVRRGWRSAQTERANLLHVCLFVLSRPSTDWVMPAHIGDRDLLYSVYQFERWSFGEKSS